MKERQRKLRCQAINHPIRKRILNALKSGPHSFLALRDKIYLEEDQLKQHLTILRRANIIE